MKWLLDVLAQRVDASVGTVKAGPQMTVLWDEWGPQRKQLEKICGEEAQEKFFRDCGFENAIRRNPNLAPLLRKTWHSLTPQHVLRVWNYMITCPTTTYERTRNLVVILIVTISLLQVSSSF